jgi:phosphoglycerate dehydrogenase-like enzyme
MAAASIDQGIIATNVEIPQDYKAKLEDPRWNHKVVNIRRVSLGEIDFGKVDVIIMGGGHAIDMTSGFKSSDARNLKLFQTLSAGVDQFDLSAIPKGATVCSNVGAFAEPMAESVFAFILSFAKNLPSLQEELRRGEFPQWTARRGTFLKGKTIGVIGAGGIGRATAKLARAFGMRTLGIASKARDIQNFDFVGNLGDLDYLLRESDFVVISIPLTTRTRGLINRDKLNEMKPSAILVNVARGPIVVEKDLYEHLKANTEFRAGIDVWWKYPKKGEKFQPDYPFTSLSNVLATPHVSWNVPEIDLAFVASAVENVLRFLSGQELRGVVNRSEYEF